MSIAPELLAEVKSLFERRIKANGKITRCMNAVESGTATYADVFAYADELGENLRDALLSVLTAENLPDGKLIEEISRTVLGTTLTNNHDRITAVAVKVQNSMNTAAGLGLKAIAAPLDTEKLNGIIKKAASYDSIEKSKWVLDEPVRLFGKMSATDTMKANADFQYEAGLAPVLRRTVVGNCCEWCAKVAGKYTYPDVPKDAWRWHERCRCNIDWIENGKRSDFKTTTATGAKKTTKAETAAAKEAVLTASETTGTLQGKTGEALEKELESLERMTDTTVKEAIRSGTVKDEINRQKQERHTEETAPAGRSYVYGSIEDSEKLYNELRGTGKALIDQNGEWKRKERVYTDRAIGVYVNEQGEASESKEAIITYSNTGSHIYPGQG